MPRRNLHAPGERHTEYRHGGRQWCEVRVWDLGLHLLLALHRNGRWPPHLGSPHNSVPPSQAVLYAAMTDEPEALLWDVRRGKCYRYALDEVKRRALLLAVLQFAKPEGLHRPPSPPAVRRRLGTAEARGLHVDPQTKIWARAKNGRPGIYAARGTQLQLPRPWSSRLMRRSAPPGSRREAQRRARQLRASLLRGGAPPGAPKAARSLVVLLLRHAARVAGRARVPRSVPKVAEPQGRVRRQAPAVEAQPGR